MTNNRLTDELITKIAKKYITEFGFKTTPRYNVVDNLSDLSGVGNMDWSDKAMNKIIEKIKSLKEFIEIVW